MLLAGVPSTASRPIPFCRQPSSSTGMRLLVLLLLPFCNDCPRTATNILKHRYHANLRPDIPCAGYVPRIGEATQKAFAQHAKKPLPHGPALSEGAAPPLDGLQQAHSGTPSTCIACSKCIADPADDDLACSGCVDANLKRRQPFSRAASCRVCMPTMQRALPMQRRRRRLRLPRRAVQQRRMQHCRWH